MYTDGEIGGKDGQSLRSDDLENLKCDPCQQDGKLIEESQVHLSRKDNCTKRCSQHKDKYVKYYCQIHKQLSCSVCLNLNHRTCEDALYIPDVAKDLEKCVEFKNVEDKLFSLSAKLNKVTADEKQNLSAFDDSYTKAIQMMEDFRQSMNDAVDKIQTELRREADGIKSTERKRVGLLTEKCEELDSKMTKIQFFRNMKQNCNVFTEMMNMINKLGSLDKLLKEIEIGQPVNQSAIKFSPNYYILDTLKKSTSFGNLTVTGRREQTGEVMGRNVMTDTRTVVKAEHLHDIHVKSAADKNTCDITGSTILPNNKLLVCDYWNQTIKAVHVQQDRVSSQLVASSGPYDIAAIDENTAAATLPTENKVVFVTVGASMTVDRNLPVGGKCWGIDYRDGKLALSFVNPDQVKVLDMKGNAVHNIMNDKAHREVLDSPFYLTFSPNNTSLYVSNWKSNTVVCVNLDGTVKAFYTDKELKYPEKVVADRRGNIYVIANGSNTLHQLTTDCQKTSVILTAADGLRNPYTISYSETENTLVVGMRDNNAVKVYRTVLG